MTFPPGILSDLITEIEQSGCSCDLRAGSICGIHVPLNRLRQLLVTPEIENFDKAVPLEAAHQIDRWGTAQDAGKAPQDWFWLVGYLAGKALRSHIDFDRTKALHHCITIAAATRNWHAHIRTDQTYMRPGIDPAGKV